MRYCCCCCFLPPRPLAAAAAVRRCWISAPTSGLRLGHLPSYSTTAPALATPPVCSAVGYPSTVVVVLPVNLLPVKTAATSHSSPPPLFTAFQSKNSRGGNRYFSTMATTNSSSSASASLYTAGVSQATFMEKEQLILVDENDHVVGFDTKYNLHRWEFINSPKKHTLHRAFSVFLFNERDELLLTQRSSDKLTFPNVWTNSLCSHPLHVPDELPDEVGGGSSVPQAKGQPTVVRSAAGVRRAARRKMMHELGVPESELPDVDSFIFLTRMHYTAPDENPKNGLLVPPPTAPAVPPAPPASAATPPPPEWGEDEMDYILFLRYTKPLPSINPEETQAVRWVSMQGLQEMFASPGLQWSPWFLKIAKNFLLPRWWADLALILGSPAAAATAATANPPTRTMANNAEFRKHMEPAGIHHL